VVPKQRFGDCSHGSLEVLVRLVFESVDGVATIKEISDQRGLDVDLTQRIVLSLIKKRFLENPEVEKRVERPQKARVLETGLAEARRTNKVMSLASRPAQRPGKSVKSSIPPSAQAAIRKRWERERAGRALKRLLSRSDIPHEPAPNDENLKNGKVGRAAGPETGSTSDFWSDDAAAKKQLAHVTRSEKHILEKSPLKGPLKAEDECLDNLPEESGLQAQ
jgi:hypothetical protein